MRRKRKLKSKSEAEFSLERVVETLSNVASRLERLEQHVFATTLNGISPPPAERRKGRKPKLATEELLERRKNLTSWLEQNWPDLSLALRKARNADAALAAMVAAKGEGTYAFQPPYYYKLEQHQSNLWQFLQSGRFHGNPKNLANAMAGLPELSWKRSFDICSKHPSKGAIALQAYRDYMLRNFPDRLKELGEARTPEQVKMVLSRSRTKDPIYLHLKEHPDKALEWLDAGKPSVR